MRPLRFGTGTLSTRRAGASSLMLVRPLRRSPRGASRGPGGSILSSPMLMGRKHGPTHVPLQVDGGPGPAPSSGDMFVFGNLPPAHTPLSGKGPGSGVQVDEINGLFPNRVWTRLGAGPRPTSREAFEFGHLPGLGATVPGKGRGGTVQASGIT